MDASDNFEFILNADTLNNVILYYCQSVISNSASLYQIATALPLYTEVISTTEIKIDSLANSTAAANQALQDKLKEV